MKRKTPEQTGFDNAIRQIVRFYSVIREDIALDNVLSSAYSMTEPSGSPRAIRVTLMPSGLMRRAIYIAVASWE